MPDKKQRGISNRPIAIQDVPDAPTVSAADVGTSRAYNNGAATVTLSNPTGGAPTSWSVTTTPTTTTTVATSSPATITGLSSATSYTVSATATNGTGVTSGATTSSAITATTVPQAPTIGTFTDGGTGTSGTLSFTAGATGGSSITGYKYSTDGSTYTSASGTTSPLSLTGLTSGTFNFSVKATNANGDSLASSSVSGTVVPLQWVGRLLHSSNTVTMWGKPVVYSGYIYVSGFSSAGTGFLAKYDTNGTLQWERDITVSAGTNYPYSVASDGAGGIYVAGYRQGDGSYWRGFIAKYDTSGTLTWKKDLYATSYDIGIQNIAAASNGSLSCVGLTYLTGTSLNNEGLLLRLSTTQTVSSADRLYSTGSASQVLYGVALDNSNNTYVAGGIAVSTVEYPYLAKYTNNTVSFQYRIGAQGRTYSAFIASDGSVYYAGDYYTSGNDQDAFLVKVNSSGTFQWSRRLWSSSFETYDGMSIAEDASGNIYVHGRTQTPSTLITKYDSSGNIQWQREFVNLSTSQGGIVIVGNYYYIFANTSVIKMPIDGSGTGITQVINGVSVTYSAGTRTDAAGPSLTSATKSQTAFTASIADYANLTSTSTTNLSLTKYGYQ